MRLDNNIHNFYEHLVLEHINTRLNKEYSDNFLEDLICLTLNRLPPRYIRHEVDMAFYLPQSERIDMEFLVTDALNASLTFLEQKHKKNV
jgi:hypothetical protein